MTPLEKALYILDKFGEIEDLGIQRCPLGRTEWSSNLWMKQVKGAALISVEEVLNSLANTDTSQFEFGWHYWQQVKQEIKKL